MNLKKDLCVLDIESTGVNPSKDRIVQIAIIKHFADGRPTEEKMKLINPTIPISPEASRVNGITDEINLREISISNARTTQT